MGEERLSVQKTNYNDELKALLRQYVHRDALVGPAAAENIHDAKVSRVLFDYHERIYKEIDKNPSLIVGRRGSGKTAYIDYLCGTDRYDVIIRLDKWRIFEDALDWLGRYEDRLHSVESLREYWDFIFYGAVLTELYEHHEELVSENDVLESFYRRVRFDDVRGAVSFVSHLFRKLIQRVKSAKSPFNLVQVALDDLYDVYDTPVDTLRDALTELCVSKRVKIAIVIDSLEEYNLTRPDFELLLSGFIKSVGSFNSTRNKPVIKCCLPSELYYFMEDVSSNTGKDFNSPLYLHWRPMELLSVIAHRMQLHCYLYGDTDMSQFSDIIAIDVGSRSGVANFFKRCFPDPIKNEVGELEECEKYILRHTQMLPRQVLKIFDAVIRENIRENGYYLPISPAAVRKGVKSLVNELARNACKAYKFQYPQAWPICRDVVGRLGLTFSIDELESLYRRHVSKHSRLTDSLDELSFGRMLMEVGCVGEVEGSSERYLKVMFEYNSIGELTVTGSGQLCVHPMFRGPNGDKVVGKGIGLAVYPIGVDPADYVDHP